MPNEKTWIGYPTKPIRETDNTLDRTGGHPTAPGDNDIYVQTMGDPDFDGNGGPGVPRVIPGPRHHEPILGSFGRPRNRKSEYDGPTAV